jgi:NTE family protein
VLIHDLLTERCYSDGQDQEAEVLEWATRKGRLQIADAVTVEMEPAGAAAGTGYPSVDFSVPYRPDDSGIALALGGGAARGWAHIGVIRALDEAKIPIRMIAGTSIGALVGGCYLAGKLDELEDFARSLTKRSIFGLLDFHLGGNGLLGGLKLTQKLTDHLGRYSFGDLSKPFVCVATEIRTGHEIWLSSGSLINAMRASYALPGVFEPVNCNNRILVDGALVNPVPVSVCRAFEEQRVVAVNLHYDHFGRAAVVKHDAGLANHGGAARQPNTARESRLGISGVMVEAFNIIQDRIARARLAGDPPDLSLHPKLGNIGLSEFHRADEAIKLGYEATIAKLEDIERLRAVLV